MISIKNKIALVTGGASGLGYCYVEELLCNDAKHVAFLDCNKSVGEAAQEKLKAKFGQERVMFLTCDVTNDEQFKDCIKKVVDTFHGLDIFINNAGILNDAQWEHTIQINIMGVIRGTLAGLNYMSKQNGGNGGTIVNVSSIVGLFPVGALPIYSASKYAVLGFSRCMKLHYEQTGVRVLVICPGATITPLLDRPGGKVLDFVDGSTVAERLAKMPSQSAEHVAQAMIKLIEKGENGAVWVCEGGQPPYALNFPHYTTLSIPV